jgi:fructuronate reductase
MKLNRANLATKTGVVAATPTERIVHIGLGAFHRAHQAWFTAQVDRDYEWGIVAFTGRSAKAAEELASQDGLFTLITRSEAGDEFEVIDSIVRAEDGNNTEVFTSAIANPQTAIVTLTITEAGYGMDASGHVDTVNPPATLHRLAVALETRRRVNGKPIAVVSCDNMPSNGSMLKVAMSDLFASFGADSVAWMNANVSFVSTSIDRITPKTTEADIATVLAATGWEDSSPVITEPFRDWVLEGEFPLGRPAWQNAGARFVDHIEPFENRKLWLLNGSHSLLAYAGQLRGHETVARQSTTKPASSGSKNSGTRRCSTCLRTNWTCLTIAPLCWADFVTRRLLIVWLKLPSMVRPNFGCASRRLPSLSWPRGAMPRAAR